MKLIVGLGNPGKKYEFTRHNIGFKIIDSIAAKQGIGFNFDKKFEAEIGESGEIKIIKPQTFMNDSGRSVQKIADFLKIDNENIIVIHDDVDLEEGIVRIALSGSSAGHKGVQSIIDNLGTENFWRVRVGIGRSDQTPTDDWVLKNFENPAEITKIIDETGDIVIELLNKGIDSKTLNVGA